MTDLRDAVATAVPVVRGLDWKFNSTNSVWSGALPFNTYYTIMGEGPKWRVFRGRFLSSADEEEVAYVADQNEAKSAANADWERLSRSIINPDFLSALDTARAEIERLQALADRLTLEAQAHAQEARTANSTIYEIYQVLSGSTSEPGNWNGAEPARQFVTAAQARIAELERTVEFVQRWAWRETKATDTERFSVIKYYPGIKPSATLSPVKETTDV